MHGYKQSTSIVISVASVPLPDEAEVCLGYVEGVEDEDVMVVLGEGHHVALASDLQAAASRHLKIETL